MAASIHPSRAGACAMLTMLILAGCTPWGEGDEPPAEDPERTERPELRGETAEERCTTFFAQGLLIEGRSRGELREELGDPVSRSHGTEPNWHVPDQVDTLWALRYQGAEVRIRAAGGRDLTERITITDDGHLRFREPTVGTDEDQLFDLLGDPPLSQDGNPQYLCAPATGPEMPLTFRLEEGRITGIAWHFYVD